MPAVAVALPWTSRRRSHSFADLVGPSGSEAALGQLKRKLAASELQAVANARAPAHVARQPGQHAGDTCLSSSLCRVRISARRRSLLQNDQDGAPYMTLVAGRKAMFS